MTTQTYAVTGLTCGHCAAAITDEVSEITGVSNVNVDLNVGGESTLTFDAAEPVSADALREAIGEAGDAYTLIAD
ncbi:cation transporter [Helcobacillus massiliensis]|uniref:Copper chaperone CopZ n=1 Tax=Helcobacillus massiliensis TaxID=521392 RepID=A0A839QZH9_9MICO|nr:MULTISPECIES: cation transporter [Helcobacillus]MBB3023361.1 copper chaperone CopZ [Helcobacillus massiliensis]MCG7426733.1 cation transporter [Helcobacillus sp. ACRRO]MCT1557694.1 cation transporter [Helcobacillus massiliensis]MCT2035966.1 cation transporter [Helcobacillus massiliensis]MCT2331764.1 cation transporter [Helcobacillus massiliensis]